MNLFSKIFLTFLVGIFLAFFNTIAVFAYEALVKLPNYTASQEGVPTSGLGGYVANLYLIAIGIAGVLAVLMIVIGGIQYIGSGMSPSGKEEAKSRITSAVLGLLLALTSYLILNTINPGLVKI